MNNWRYHVAPVVFINFKPFIVDPLFDHEKALTVDQWVVEKLKMSGNVTGDINFTNPHLPPPEEYPDVYPGPLSDRRISYKTPEEYCRKYLENIDWIAP